MVREPDHDYDEERHENDEAEAGDPDEATAAALLLLLLLEPGVALRLLAFWERNQDRVDSRERWAKFAE